MQSLRLIVVILILFVYQKDLTHALVVGVSSIECQSSNDSYLEFQLCQLKPVSRGVKEISINVKLLVVPVNNCTVRLEFKRRGYFTKSLYSYIVDGCAFMRNKKRNPVANAFFQFLQFSTYSNINHTCPYDHDIIVDRFRIDRDLKFNLPIEKGEYTIFMFWYIYNKLSATVTANLQFHD